MALQASGPISFSQIANEFGLTPNRNLGAYRVSQTVGELIDLPLDTDIPTSGPIGFSTFYSKKLNVVVNCGSGSRINARTLYDNAINTIAIGGYRNRPISSSGIKVWIHVAQRITTSSALGQLYCALLTGNWNNNTDLILDIGPSGSVLGMGGNGGTGGDVGGGNGQNGSAGSSAIGVTYQPIFIRNRGFVLSGTGGGGGGAGARSGRLVPEVPDNPATPDVNEFQPAVETRLNVGGGGGGGGRPFGQGGGVGSGDDGVNPVREPGQPAGEFTQGPGGRGGFAPASGGSTPADGSTLTGGAGGSGGSAGGGASGTGQFIVVGTPGAPGPSGFDFVISGSSANVTTSGPVSAIYNTNPI